MSLLDKCIIFAIQKHSGQIDKVGLPYIYHPLRVMLNPALKTEDQKCIAILHDVLEDTNCSQSELMDLGLNMYIRNSLLCLTHPKNEPNIHYWERILSDPTGNARLVKLADIEDNTSPARMNCLPEEDQIRLNSKYNRAMEILTKNYK
jgi:GTP diphosphokinase / guanosine-3',5'-bis(diphosphate) 3'-diphosphatase